tara:strand:+ start:517 stop:774 length:258 start_codon:yes stop_codon:yes gene_type:complete
MIDLNDGRVRELTSRFLVTWDSAFKITDVNIDSRNLNPVDHDSKFAATCHLPYLANNRHIRKLAVVCVAKLFIKLRPWSFTNDAL